ncbi:MAG: hypothetical protein ACU0C9_07470, partial [Paracoccaceae bacterium]
MKIGFSVLFISAVGLAGCGGGGGTQTFSERFAVHEALFAHVDINQDETLPSGGTLPTGTAVYTGVMGMTIDVDAILAAPGGDFRAAGDFTINIDFGGTPMI